MISVTISEAGQRFGLLLNRVREERECVEVEDSGVTVAYIIPAPERPTGATLARAWGKLPHLDPDEAGRFEADMLDSRAELRPVASPWE